VRHDPGPNFRDDLNPETDRVPRFCRANLRSLIAATHEMISWVGLHPLRMGILLMLGITGASGIWLFMWGTLQSRAINDIEKNGGGVSVWPSSVSDTCYRILGVDAVKSFGTPVQIIADTPRIGDDNLAMEHFRTLRELHLNNSSITVRTIHRLTGLTQLRELCAG